MSPHNGLISIAEAIPIIADLYPNCQVTGIDLSPGQPALYVPKFRYSTTFR